MVIGRQGNGIGMKIVGGKLAPGCKDVGAYVATIFKGGVAEQLHGELQEGIVLKFSLLTKTLKTCLFTEKYSKTCVKRSLSKRPEIGLQDKTIAKCRSEVLKNAQRGACCKRSTFMKLPFFIKIFVLSVFEWPFLHRFTVQFDQF